MEEELALLGSLILVGGGVRILIRSGVSRIEAVPRSHRRTGRWKRGRGKCLDRVIDIDGHDRLKWRPYHHASPSSHAPVTFQSGGPQTIDALALPVS